ncbi:MAG: hypothetical protein WDN28_20490 [Chthoniobacter sp.]
MRTIIGRTGLTRSGIFGSAFGRPEMASNSTNRPHEAQPRDARLHSRRTAHRDGLQHRHRPAALLFSTIELQKLTARQRKLRVESIRPARRLLDCLSRDMRRSIGGGDDDHGEWQRRRRPARGARRP